MFVFSARAGLHAQHTMLHDAGSLFQEIKSRSSREAPAEAATEASVTHSPVPSSPSSFVVNLYGSSMVVADTTGGLMPLVPPSGVYTPSSQGSTSAPASPSQSEQAGHGGLTGSLMGSVSCMSQASHASNPSGSFMASHYATLESQYLPPPPLSAGAPHSMRRHASRSRSQSRAPSSCASQVGYPSLQQLGRAGSCSRIASLNRRTHSGGQPASQSAMNIASHSHRVRSQSGLLIPGSGDELASHARLPASPDAHSSPLHALLAPQHWDPRQGASGSQGPSRSYIKSVREVAALSPLVEPASSSLSSAGENPCGHPAVPDGASTGGKSLQQHSASVLFDQAGVYSMPPSQQQELAVLPQEISMLPQELTLMPQELAELLQVPPTTPPDVSASGEHKISDKEVKNTHLALLQLERALNDLKQTVEVPETKGKRRHRSRVPFQPPLEEHFRRQLSSNSADVSREDRQESVGMHPAGTQMAAIAGRTPAGGRCPSRQSRPQRRPPAVALVSPDLKHAASNAVSMTNHEHAAPYVSVSRPSRPSPVATGVLGGHSTSAGTVPTGEHLHACFYEGSNMTPAAFQWSYGTTTENTTSTVETPPPGTPATPASQFTFHKAASESIVEQPGSFSVGLTSLSREMHARALSACSDQRPPYGSHYGPA